MLLNSIHATLLNSSGVLGLGGMALTWDWVRWRFLLVFCPHLQQQQTAITVFARLLLPCRQGDAGVGQQVIAIAGTAEQVAGPLPPLCVSC